MNRMNLFDLTGEVATARASYDLANVSDRDVALDLLFISPIGDDLLITLEGMPLEVHAEPNADLPEEWRLSTRSVDPLTGEEYELNTAATHEPSSAYSFDVQLKAGARATLDATFTPLLTVDRARHEYITRHLTYVLGPAKNWAGFGTLEVSVAAPSRYVLGASPALRKVGEAGGVARYSGTFDGVPAEVLKLATISNAAVAPRPLWESVKVPIGIVLPIVAAALVGIGLGGWLARIRRPWLAGLAAGGLTFVVSAAIGVGMGALMSVPTAASDPAELSNAADYVGITLFVFWVVWVICVLPALAALLGALRAAILSSRRSMEGRFRNRPYGVGQPSQGR